MKSFFTLRIAGVVIATILVFTLAIPSAFAAYVWTPQTGSGSRNWTDVTSSGDGMKLAATVNGGYIYTSTDGGVSWGTQGNSSGTGTWSTITSSDDGMTLAAAMSPSSIYTSTDGGATWTERTSSPSRYWLNIASSFDGTKLAAVDPFGASFAGGYVWTSIDSGVTWVQQTTSGIRDWENVAISDDGTKIAAVVVNGYIFTSTDSGATWSTNSLSSGSRTWRAITSSSDGTKLAAGVQGGLIYTSTNSGVNWTARAGSGSRSWSDITSSADGTTLAAIDGGTGIVYVSYDSGVTWSSESSASGVGTWRGISMSNDGLKIVSGNANSYVTTATPFIDNTAPVISSISSNTPATSTVSITWTTNEAASSSISYGLTTSYGTVATSSNSTSTHSVSLTGLTPSTTYNYRVLARDPYGNISTSSNQTFITAALPATLGGCATTYLYDFENGVVTTITCGKTSTSTIPGFTPTTSTSTINSSTATTASSTSSTPTVVCPSGTLFNQQTGERCNSFVAVSTPTVTTNIFTRDLSIGSIGEDVRNLQKFLNSKGFIVSLSGAGSLGKETNIFGSLTKIALSKFQLKNNISPAVGYFGPITRAWVSSR